MRGRERVGVRCAARRVSGPSRGRPTRCTHGSLCVIQCSTRSPRRPATASTYSQNASTVARTGQPPSSSIACGVSQWKSVEERRDAVAEQLVDEPVVEVEALRVHRPAALRDDARPRDREAERVEPELAHERDVVADSGGRSRTRPRRCRRFGPCPASRRSDPRRSRHGRPRLRRPRSGTRRSPLPRRSRQGTR